MSISSTIDHFRERIGARFGRNKTNELCRLLYEIGRREVLDPEQIMREAFEREDQTFEQISFSKLKQLLLKRRFPNLSDRDLKRIYLTPLAPPPPEVDSVSEKTPELPFKPNQIFIEQKARHYPLTKRILSAWPRVPVREIRSVRELRKPREKWIAHFGKRTIAVTVERFDLVKPCPCSSRTVSCNYFLLNIGYGCPFDCSYCYLQDYQNLPAILLPANLEEFAAEISAILERNPKRFKRIGTGEFTDSLALDGVTEYTKTLVPFFADKEVLLELKTKSDCIQNLRGLDHGGKTVIAWSLNPDRFTKEEKGTAGVLKRLEAARLCEREGYGTAFHFDPIFEVSGWETDYKELVGQVFSHVDRSIRWFSLGTLRFHKDLRRAAEARHPESDIFLGEERLDPVDGKMRYATESRIAIYQKMVGWIREHHSTVPIYLCMEPAAVWKAVFGNQPYGGKIDDWITNAACKE